MAFEAKTGKVVWEMQLPAGATGGMITYQHRGKQYILLPIGSRNHPAEFVALALPS